jgi:fused signal recognition particle receptor
MLDTGTIVLLAFLVVAIIAIGLATRKRRATELPKAETQPEAKPPERAAPEEAGEEEEAAVPEPAEDKRALKAGLAKTRGGFIAKIAALFSKRAIDKETLDQLEEVLLTADIGVRTASKLFEAVKQKLSKDQLADTDAIWAQIREESAKILDVGAPPLDFGKAKPFVILMIGVNGVGKTTTIGKLSSQFAAQGKKVLLAAGDTFRAAATEQLAIWGARTGAPVVRGKEGGDPSSVIFDAVKKAQAEGYDIVIADTAGRLHTKTDLMDELIKVRRVLAKAQEGAPHETFLVIDANTGQNAIEQAKLFQKTMALTGIVLTKLDGTAKGGVILGICDELKVPVRYVGIGEKVADLRPFHAAEFLSALYDRDESEKNEAA